MRDGYWNGLFDTRWEDEPLGQEAIRLVLRLRRQGYAERTCRDHGHAVVHLGKVLHEEFGGVDRVRDESFIAAFVDRHLPNCSCYRQPPGQRLEHVRRALRKLVTMLREDGLIPPPERDLPAAYQELMDGYSHFLLHDRGLAETTVINYRRYLRDFLASRTNGVSPAELVQLTADDLLAFSRQRGAELGYTAWNHLAASLSTFYRWLDLRGYGGVHLVRAVPLRRRYRLADVPCALSWDQVQGLLGVIDRHLPNGRRNYAMLLLFATYGVRGCEVRDLRLDAIDWPHDTITIFASKTGRSRRLPLTRAVGEAILDYLREERPASKLDELFLSSQPPHGRLRSKINPWLRRQLDKAGIDVPRGGAHILRHSFAVHLVRSGETLKGIGDLLGHRNTDTTFIYTKLHLDDLRTVALEPEMVS